MKPSPLQRATSTLVRNLVFKPWIWREHPQYLSFRKELAHSQYSTAEQLARIQLERLNALLGYVWQHCPFYRQRMEQCGLTSGEVQSLDQFQAMQLTSKQDIQVHAEEIRSRRRDEHHPVRNQTGGSTGSPIQFDVDRLRFGTRLATSARTDEWAGLRHGDWHAYLWGASLDLESESGWWPMLRNHLLRRRIELNTSSISDADWTLFLAKLRRFRPRVFVAYSQAAVLFARYIRERQLNDIQFDSIITTAEVCSPEDRALIESVFRGKVFNRYGCREVSTIAAECEFHSGLHVSAESLLVEIVPDDTTPPGMGKVVVTDLLNRSFPLIRYEIGDVAAWAEDQACPCGRGLPLIGRLEGRLTDFLTLRDGRKLSGVALLTWVFASMDEVRQVQFIQHGVGDLTLRYVPGHRFSKDTEAHLRERLRPYLQGQAELGLECVPEIAKERSGKYRFIVHAPRASNAAAQDAIAK